MPAGGNVDKLEDDPLIEDDDKLHNDKAPNMLLLGKKNIDTTK